MRVFLVRHGQTDYNLRHQSQRGRDPPLNATGVRQCERCAGLLDAHLQGHSLDAVFCSSLQRATQTAEILMQHRAEPAIYEESTSLAEGCLKTSMERYTTRILKMAHERGFANILIVSHSSVIRYMLRWMVRLGQMEVPAHMAIRMPHNAAISQINVASGNATLVLYNDLPAED